MKKIIAIILSLIMALSLVSSFAAGISDASLAGTKSIKGAYITYDGKDKGAYGEGGVSFLTDGTRNTFGARLGGVLKIQFGSEVSFSGIRTWMSDNCVSGAEGKHFDVNMNGKDHRRAAVLLVQISSDGKTWKEVPNEREANNDGWYDSYKFSEKVSAKYISITPKKSNDGWGEWEIGELALITDEDIASKVKVDMSTITKVEEEIKTHENAYAYDSSWKLSASSAFYSHTAERAFDGNAKTHWHSAYEATDGKITSKAPYPHYITVDFGKTLSVAGVIYTPRTDNLAGRFNNYIIYGSTDGTNFEEIIKGDCDYSAGFVPQYVNFEKKVDVKAIRISTTDAGDGFGSATEIAILKEKVENKTETKKAPVTGDGLSIDGIPFLDRSGWKATGKSFVAGSPMKILDGDTKTHWHSDYQSADGVVTGMDNPPYVLEVTLPKAEVISGVSLHPRGDGLDVGKILKMNLYVAKDDASEYFLLFENVEFPLNTGSKTPREILFNANISVKKVKIEILEGAQHFGTLGEFNLLSKRDEFETVSFEEFYEVDAKNRLYLLDTKDFSASYFGDCWNDYTVDKAFDGPDGSMFQTAELGQKDYPVIISLDMGSVRTFSEMHYLPRQTQDHHGLWLRFSLSVSEDGENYQDILINEKLKKDLSTKKFTFDTPIKARYMEFIIEQSAGNRVACKEIEFYQNKEAHDAESENTASKKEKYELTIGSNVIKSEKDGNIAEKTIDVAPYIVDGSTMIPLRGLVEEMGAEIAWDGENKKITIKTKDSEIVLQIWNRRVFVTNKEFGEVRYTLRSFPVIKDSRTFIPVRFVSEQLGYNVAWDGATQTVTITK